MLYAVYLWSFEIFLQVSLPGPKLTDNKTVRPGLNQIDTNFFSVRSPAQFANRFIGDFMPAAGAAARLVVEGFSLNRYILFAVGSVAGSCPSTPVLIENVILRNANFTYPAVPVLGQCRGQRHIRIPGVSFFLVLAYPGFLP